MKITTRRRYTTRSGRPVRIYATRCGGMYPIHGAIFDDSANMWTLGEWDSAGCVVGDDTPEQYDLIPAKPRAAKRKRK